MLPDFILEQLKEFYKGEITDDFLQEISQNAQYLELEKGEILFSDKKTKSQNFLLLKGSAVRIIMTEMGQEKAVSFHTEHFLPLLGKIFISEKPSTLQYRIKINENSKIIALDFEKVLTLLKKYPSLNEKIIYNQIQYIKVINQLQEHLIGLNSENFLKWLLQEYPFIFQRFQSKDIASLMGITPEWLSKLKRKLFQHKENAIS